jgi:hypothetical protein
MAKKKPLHIETKFVAPGIFNLLPGPDYKSIVTWSDGTTSKGYGDTRDEAERNAIRNGAR